MLQNIRDNSQGWIAKTIIGIIIVLLALTGVEAIFNSSGNAQNAAEVNGEPITRSQLEQAVSMQRSQLRQQLGSEFDDSMLNEDLLRQSAMTGLVDRTLLLQAARDAGFSYSQAALDQVILQTPEFQVDGRFEPSRFDQVLQQMGYTRLQFRQMLEEEMLIGQLRAGIAGSGFVTEQQIEDFARLERQARDFATITIPANAATVEVSEEEINRFYAANAERLRSPEQVVIEYVQLDKSAFFDQVSVDDQQVQALYEQQIANLAEQRRAAHILIETGGELDEEQAKARLEEIRTRLEQGEDFAALAKELSQDPGSASEGGDLGFAGPGVYDPAFEEALFALKEGEVSEPVHTEFGWHLIKLLDVQAPEVPSLESMRPELERQLKAEQVEQRFVEASKQLEAAAYEASDLAQPAEELGLEVQVSPAFGREGGTGVTMNRQVIQAAFGEQVLLEGANSELIELDPDTAIVLRVKEHQMPETLPLEEVRDEIVARLQQEKAREQAREQGEAMLARLRAGETVDAEWQIVEAATRDHEGVDPAVLREVFQMPRPQGQEPSRSGLALANGDYVVLRLDGVSEPEDALSEEEKQEYRRFLASRAGQQAFMAYMERLRAEAEIERF